MLIKINNDKDIDTDDFNSEERHVLQKLIGWKSLVNSMAEFQKKKESALFTGWNNSGPIHATENLTLVIEQLEKELRLKLEKKQRALIPTNRVRSALRTTSKASFIQ